MAIATTILDQTVFGNKKIVIGKSVLSGSTNTGDVETGLIGVDMFIPLIIATTQQGFSVNETFPLASGDVTAYAESNDSTFNWIAIGH